jgi:hypothetical protein
MAGKATALAQVDWNQEQPALLYVRELVGTYLPVVGLWHDATLSIESGTKVRDHKAQGVGGFKARTTAEGGFSRHSEGRGADIYVDTRNPWLKSIGDALFQELSENMDELGIEDLMWNRQVCSDDNPEVHAISTVKSKKTGQAPNPHLDHLHVGFSRVASQRRSPLLKEIFMRVGHGVGSVD